MKRKITVCLGYPGEDGEHHGASFTVEARSDREAFDKAEELLLQKLLLDAAKRARRCTAHYYEDERGRR